MAKEMTSVGELAKELGISKSLLHYYHSIGLVEAENFIGKMIVLDRVKTKKRIAQIKKYKKEGLTLKQIVKELKK